MTLAQIRARAMRDNPDDYPSSARCDHKNCATHMDPILRCTCQHNWCADLRRAEARAK